VAGVALLEVFAPPVVASHTSSTQRAAAGARVDMPGRVHRAQSVVEGEPAAISRRAYLAAGDDAPQRAIVSDVAAS